MSAQDREALVQNNQAAERRVLDALERDVGIRLTRLDWLRTFNAADSAKLLPWISSLVKSEPHPLVRQILYVVMYNAAALDEHVCWMGLALLRTELDVDCRRVLASLVALSKDPTTRQALREELLLRPNLASLEDILRLAVAARNDGVILSRCRAAFENGLFDLEALSVIANRHEREYNLLSEAPPYGSRRLTGRECTNIFQHQVSGSEYAFRRADLIPYFGCVSQLQPVTRDERAAAAFRMVLDNGFSSDAGTVSTACEEPFVYAKALTVKTSGPGVRAIVLLRRKTHRDKASKEFLCLLEVPPLREDNLLPKRLLPPTDPARSVQAEA